MPRIPSNLTLEEVQQAFRDLHDIIQPLERGNFDLNRRRVTNAGDAVLPADYVTKRQMEDFILGIRRSNRMLLGVPAGEAANLLVGWLINGVHKANTQLVNFASLSGDSSITISAPLIVGGLMEYFFKANAGGAIAPFTKLFEWNQTDFSQFTIEKTGTWNADVLKDYSDQGTTNVVRPYIKVSSAAQAGAQHHFMYTTNGLDALTNGGIRDDLWIVFDVAQVNGVTPLDNTGLFIGKNSTPTADHYHLGITSSNLRLNKFIGSTKYLQAGDPAFALSSDGDINSHARVNVVIKPDGKCIVSVSGGQTGYIGRVFRHKMTITEGTTITSGETVKVGFRVRSPDGSGTTFIWSHLAVYSAPANAEQLRP